MNGMALIFFLAGGLFTIAQLTPVEPVGGDGQELIVIGGAAREFRLVVKMADENSTHVRVLTQLWQAAGELAAPVSPVSINDLACGGGIGICSVTNDIPQVTTPTKMMLCWRLLGTSEAATTRLLVLPEEPIRALTGTLTNRLVALAGAAEGLTDWLQARDLTASRVADELVPGFNPLVVLAGPSSGDNLESLVKRIEGLAAKGVPVVWFGTPSEPASFDLAIVRWYHRPNSASLVFLPATWQSKITNDLLTEHRFAETLRSLLDLKSPVQLIAVTKP
jgi:hypothetical protein